MGCEATRSARERPMLVGRMWECDGTNLVELIPAGATMPPAVIRADLIPYLDDAAATCLPGRPFAGGDHSHINLALPLPIPREDAS